MDELTSISSGLYKLTGDIIGPEPVLNMRRAIMDLRRQVSFLNMPFDGTFEEIIYSGSKAEGLRFSSSDSDFMWVRRGIRVQYSLTQCSLSDNVQTLLLAEYDKTKPGFVLLQLISKTTDAHVMKSCLQYENKHYLSSTLWVRHGYFAAAWPDSFTHGPCRSGVYLDSEYDHAECLKSDTLPPTSIPSFSRLHQVGHLTREKLESIYRTGCHFVAVCSKKSTFERLEWRVSFSSAEKVIIHSMNQTQIICYGLLKIFLKEAIDVCKDTEGLICSYFMKTVVFWKLLDRRMRWSPQYLFECFCKCLQVLIHFVDAQCCPNFFIPENNMFADKYTGAQQTALMKLLSDLLHEGIYCLLRCPSLSRELYEIIKRPLAAHRDFSNLDHVSKSRFDSEMITEICIHCPFLFDFNKLAAALNNMEHLSRDMYRHHCIRSWRNVFISRLILLQTSCPCGCSGKELNKNHYKTSKKCLSTMKSCIVDATSNLMHMAVYLYRYERYKEVLQVLSKLKFRLQNPSIMCTTFL